MDPRGFSSDAPGGLQYSPAGYWSYLPYALPPLFRWTGELVAALSAADRAVIRLKERLREPPPGFFEWMALLEAVESCRLAGWDVSAEDVLGYEAGYRRPGQAGPQPIEAARRSVYTLLQASRRAPGEAPSLEEIESAHAGLFTGPWDERWPPGRFRRGPTWVGGAGPLEADFVPPPPDAMREGMRSLVDFMRADQSVPPLVRLAMVHVQFGAIHPFYTANGRLARLLVPVLLIAWDLLPGPALALSAYFRAQEGAFRGLQRAVRRENAWGRWFVFYLNGLRERAESCLDRMDRLESLREELYSVVEGERAAGRMHGVIDLLLTRPYVNVHQVLTALPGGACSAPRASLRLTHCAGPRPFRASRALLRWPVPISVRCAGQHTCRRAGRSVG